MAVKKSTTKRSAPKRTTSSRTRTSSRSGSTRSGSTRSNRSTSATSSSSSNRSNSSSSSSVSKKKESSSDGYDRREKSTSLSEEREAESKAKSLQDKWLDSPKEDKAQTTADSGKPEKSGETGDAQKSEKSQQSGESAKADKPNESPGEKLGQDLTGRMQTLARENPQQLEAILRQSLSESTPEGREKLMESARNGELPLPQNVSFAGEEQLNGARAAYSPENNGTVLLSESLRDNPEALRRAYTEEVGHHFDNQLSQKDSKGDEGQLFQEGLEQGKPVSEQRAKQLKAENDHGKAQINGRQTPVENSGIERARQQQVADQLLGRLQGDDPALRQQSESDYKRLFTPGSDYYTMSESLHAPIRQSLRNAANQEGASQQIKDLYHQSLTRVGDMASKYPNDRAYSQDLVKELQQEWKAGRTSDSQVVLDQLKRAPQGRDVSALRGQIEQGMAPVKERQVKNNDSAALVRQAQEQPNNQNISQLKDTLDSATGAVQDKDRAQAAREQLAQQVQAPGASQELRNVHQNEVIEGRLPPLENGGGTRAQTTPEQRAEFINRWENVEDQRRLTTNDLAQGERRLEGHDREFAQSQAQAMELAQEMDRNSSGRNYAEQLRQNQGRYQELLRMEGRTDAQTREMERLGERIDGYYANGSKYTRMAERQLGLEQSNRELQDKLANGTPEEQRLRESFSRLTPAEQQKVGQEYRERQQQRVADGNRAGQPELNDQNRRTLDAFSDPNATPRQRDAASQQLLEELKKPAAAGSPSLADSLATRMEMGDPRAFDLLRQAAPTNQRAQQLLQNMKLSEREKENIAAYTDTVTQSQDWNGGSERRLNQLMEHRGTARETIVDGMTDYIANHTSELKKGEDAQNSQALENFLQRHSNKHEGVREQLETAKIGQARMDLMETWGDTQESGRRAISQAMAAGGERAEAARKFLAEYEGSVGSGVRALEQARDYDSIAAVGQAKNAHYDVRTALASGGQAGLDAVQRQWDNLNDQGRRNAGSSFEDNKALAAALQGEGSERLTQLVGESISYANLEGNNRDLVHGRLDALDKAKTEAGRDALANLSGDERGLYRRGEDTVGERALEMLAGDKEGRDRYIDAVKSQEDGTRRNALRVMEQDFRFGNDWSPEQKGELLENTVSALGRTEDPKFRETAINRIRKTANEPSYVSESDRTPFQSRAESYGALMAQADSSQGDQAQELKTLANDVGGLNPPGYSLSPDTTRLERQQALEQAASGEQNQPLAEQLKDADKNAMLLADARMRHSGQEGGLVERLDGIRRNDPQTYQQILAQTTNSNSWGRHSGELSGFLQERANSTPSDAKPVEGLSAERQQALTDRLSPIEGKLAGAPDNAAGRMAQDVQRTQDFTTQMNDLYRQRDNLAARGQDTAQIDKAIDQAVSEHENSRFDSQGMNGRLEAAGALGDRFDQIENIANSQGLSGQEFDNLLMKSAELSRLGNNEALDNLLRLGQGENGLSSSEMNLMMDMAPDMSSTQFRNLVAGAETADEARANLRQSLQNDLNDFAQNERDRWFGNEGRFDSRGERMIDFLVDNGGGADLLYNKEGGLSPMDRLMREESPDARKAAEQIVSRIQETAPENSALSRAGQVAEQKLHGSPKGERPDATIARLETLHADTSRLSEADRDLQTRVNSDVRFEQTRSILERENHESLAGLERASNAHKDLLDKIQSDQDALPEGDKFKAQSVQLEASRQAVDGRLDDIKAKQNKQELERQQELMLENGMNHRQIEALINSRLNSATDSIFLGVNAQVGLEVQAPLFGSAEAFVEGKMGFQVAMTEDDKVAVSFDARIGAGAGAQVGSDSMGLGANAGAEGFQKLTYTFDNVEAASRFTSAMFYDVQEKMGHKPDGPRPTYLDPVTSQTGGVHTTAGVQIGPVHLNRDTTTSTRTVTQQKPWLAAEAQKTRDTQVYSVEDTWSGEFKRPNGSSYGLSFSASDQRGDRNQIGNGTDLQVRVQLGVPLGSSQSQIREDLVSRVMNSMDQMKPGWRGDKSIEEARKALNESFAGRELKVNANGALEFNFSSPENLMTNERGEMTGNGLDVLTSWAQNQFSSQPETLWQMNSVRAAAELELSASGRARYGTGFVNAFAELGLNFKYRDATTLTGSLWHGRYMLYGHRNGTSFDRTQIAELQKDGIISSEPRTRGQIDNNKLNYSLGRMRSELMGLYNDPAWRAQNATLPDGTVMDRQRFERNIDTFLLSSRDAVYGGVEKTGRQQDRAAFQEAVNLNSIEEAQKVLEERGLMDDREAAAYREYLDHINGVIPMNDTVAMQQRQVKEFLRKRMLAGAMERMAV